jgi:hypothetical protein
MFSELPDDEENQNECEVLKQKDVTQHDQKVVHPPQNTA